jgi:transposase
MAYPAMVRKRIVELAARDGMKTARIAELFGICRSGTRRVKQQHRERGTHLPKAYRPGREPLMTDAVAGRARGFVATRKDATRAEAKDALGLTVSVQTVGEWLRRPGLVLKKSRSAPPSRTGPTSGPAATPGAAASRTPTRTRSSSSTRAAPAPT